MSDYLTALTGAGTTVAVGLVIVARAATAPRRGRHRAPAYITVPLDHLMPAWPEPTHGVLAAQAFAWCPLCRAEVTVVVHGEGAQRCDRNHVTITRAGGGC